MTKINEIGKRIKTLRQSKSMSQAHLAEASDVDVQTIRRSENSENPSSSESLLSICSVLDVDAEQLKREAKVATKPKAKVGVVGCKNGQDLLNALTGAHSFRMDVDDVGDDEEVAGLVKDILTAVETAEVLPEVPPTEIYDEPRRLTKTLKDLEAHGWSVMVTRKAGTVMATSVVDNALSIPDWKTAMLSIKRQFAPAAI